MNAEIIAIGSELLLGETVDTNSSYLARHFAALGINLFRKAVVGDNQERIASMIEEALERVDLVVCTGGLGPTVDDMTREAVARAVGRPLVFHQHLLDQIEARFRSFGRTMSPSNRQQAYVPEGARIIENPRGTAPSFIVEDPRGTIVVLPGVPSEMSYLWETAVIPYLRDERGATSIILVKTLHATGMGESVIGELIADLMEQTNPTVGISAKRGQYELRIGARADTRAEAEALVAHAEATMRERLGAALIGDETLEGSVVRMLTERGLRLALYEGTIRAPVLRAFSAIPAGRLLIGGATLHPGDIPADSDGARSLAFNGAQHARQQWRTPLGIGVQPAANADADGFTEVSIAIDRDAGAYEFSRRIDLNLEEGWEFISTSVFDELRRLLIES